ncbi:MAG: molybdenum cofactor guanylyltransferase [Candidatus Promineifilaceae bacterium]
MTAQAESGPAQGGVTVAIMAGGKSSRMGADKSFVPLLGRRMIEHVYGRLAGLGAETMVITNRPEAYAFLGLPLYSDVTPDAGPLGGLYTALLRASQPHLLIVACDMPWLCRDLLAHQIGLRHTADVIAPRWETHPEPLHAVYSRACLGPIESCLAARQLKMTAFYGRVRLRLLDRAEIAVYDPLGRSFANINTPEELAAAEEGQAE